MKIGIITLSASNNCGSMLQAYALKKLLEPFGDVEIINFYSVSSHKIYNIFSPQCFRNKRLLLRKLYKIRSLLAEKRGYYAFRKKYLKISGKELYNYDLKEIADKYDIVVCGSDQVWNVMMGDFEEAFLAGWSNAKKVAYAPSLGGHDIRENRNAKKYIEYIKEFYALSVREEKGKKCLEEVTGRKVEKLLDPTLVIDIKEWKNLVGPPLVEGDYFFFYSWAYNDNKLLEIVSAEGKKNKVDVYVVDARKWIFNNPRYWGFTLSKKEGPLAFLNLMYYARRCYVESFHGMIFAYLFRKDFWLLDTHKEFENIDTRLKELLLLLDMKDRVLTEFNVEDINQSKNVIFADNIELKTLEKESFEYIRRSIN